MSNQPANSIGSIEAMLPNGFHDAALRRIELDFERRGLSLLIAVDVSDPESGRTEYEYRLGRLSIFGLMHVTFDRLDRITSDRFALLTIDLGSSDVPAKTSAQPLASTRFEEGWMFISDANGFIRFSGESAVWEWLDRMPT